MTLSGRRPTGMRSSRPYANDWIFQLKDTNMGKDINLIGRIFRVSNIEHITHSIPDAVVFDNMLIGYYLEKGDFLVIGVIAVELSTFVGYVQ